MPNSQIFKHSLGFSILAVIYIFLVANIMQHAESIFDANEETLVAPITFLLLLVVSVATMGMLIFGKPVMLYMDGKKQEAVKMICYTIGCLAGFVVLLLIIMSLI